MDQNLKILFKQNIDLFDSSNVNDSIISLIGSMTVVEMIDNPNACYQNVINSIRRIAEDVDKRVKSKNEQALLAHLGLELYGDDEKHPYLIVCNYDNYNNPNSNHIGQVCKTGSGLSSLLAAIYVSAAKILGINAFGVAPLGFFYIGIKSKSETLYLNPENGVEITVDEMRESAAKVFLSDMPEENFCPVSNKLWLTRILQNALRIYQFNGQLDKAATILEMEIMLYPEEKHLIRDLGLVLAQINSPQAHSTLKEYISTAASLSDEKRDDILELMKIL